MLPYSTKVFSKKDRSPNHIIKSPKNNPAEIKKRIENPLESPKSKMLKKAVSEKYKMGTATKGSNKRVANPINHIEETISRK